jgi:hypothetical protein
MTDLFGRPIYDAPRAKQAPLFGDRHWFELGYRDGMEGDYTAADSGKASAAYLHGFQAAVRDRTENGRCDAARAWRENVAVGNVAEG